MRGGLDPEPAAAAERDLGRRPARRRGRGGDGDLDPGDEDRLDGTGRGGLSETTEETLNGLIYAMPEVSAWLTPAQQLALLGIVHGVSGIPKLLANDPGTLIEGGGLIALCTVLDVACRTAPASRA
ncbi:hypothetical protein ABZ926_14105 [Streptomyces litmocidini]|uniref:hypothetical protein n=1 Tax=Streptomyces litmocidini TaxID=67318 RepID=UPI0034104DDE